MKMGKNEKGLTIVELLVGIAILSIIGAGIFGIMFTSNQIYNTSSSRLDAATYNREVSAAITNELRYASKVKALGSTLQYTVASNSREIKLDTIQHALIANEFIIAPGQVESLNFTAKNSNGKATITAIFNLYGKSNNTVTITTINSATIE
ncbi:Type IV pilin N-term methylation site GFxxxE [Propionispora vibrioides]|uniref:Type IV pilin N-term methylation site GFxxxE n=2 Tax=Propionispora vibrioides TaxID=112903 RepID=A0A1H8P0U3_9FIRM|nr:Type IV pilin N-term methylation site GFxxxE [Propionispora vibrioides]